MCTAHPYGITTRHDEGETRERSDKRGQGQGKMWQVKNSENVIDYEFIGEYYIKISCECGYQWATIRRNGVMKRVLRVIKGHACEREGKQ